MGFFDRLSNGWALGMQAFGVLRQDKHLLVFPLVSGLACLAVLASFALPLWNSDYVAVVQDEGQMPQDPVAYVLLFLFYFANYFVIVFFNSALVACAIIRFNGGQPSLGDGFRAASARLPQIFGWALVAATVGMILRLIESRSEKAGRFVAGLLGMAWSAVTYFVVPVIVVEKLGPLGAVRRSLAVLRRTWGEALAANFGIGFIVFLLFLVALAPAVGGFLIGTPVSVIVGVLATVLLWILISLISATVHTIVLAALYQYAVQGTAPDAFDDALVRQAFSVR